jgi:hypothetical protein
MVWLKVEAVWQRLYIENTEKCQRVLISLGVWG